MTWEIPIIELTYLKKNPNNWITKKKWLIKQNTNNLINY